MLRERICGGGLRGRECLSVGKPGRELVYRGLVCRKVWRRAPLSIGAPLERMGGGGSVHRELWKIVEAVHWKRSISLYGCSEGNLEGGSFSRDPEGYVEKALETGISIRALLGNLEGGSYKGDVER